MKVIIESAGKVASRVRLGEHEIVFDQPPPVRGGEDRGPSPLDVLVASVGACAHYYAAAFLQARGVPVATLAVEVEADKEHLPVPRVARLALKVRVPDSLSEQQLIGVVRAIKRCPAYGTLVSAPAVDLSVEIVRAEGDGRQDPASA
jgi:uncharacterized OsmC-like protein